MAGLLTDRRIDRKNLPDDDRFNASQWDDAYRRLGKVEDHFGDAIESWTTFPIKFALCHPVVTSLIVGLNSVDQVDQVIDSADGNYPDRRAFDRAKKIFEAP